MKTVIYILTAFSLAIGCSKPTDKSAGVTAPQFQIATRDVSSASVSVVTGQILANPTQEVALLHVRLTERKAKEFQKFTREHIKQKIQIVIFGKVATEPVILQEITSGQLDLPYSSSNEASTVAQSLGKR
jgi:preprotein translocase subunit SecD